jgi:hypothetical protein
MTSQSLETGCVVCEPTNVWRPSRGNRCSIIRCQHAGKAPPPQISENSLLFYSFGGASMKTLIDFSGRQASAACLIIRRRFRMLFIFWATRRWFIRDDTPRA